MYKYHTLCKDKSFWKIINTLIQKNITSIILSYHKPDICLLWEISWCNENERKLMITLQRIIIYLMVKTPIPIKWWWLWWIWFSTIDNKIHTIIQQRNSLAIARETNNIIRGNKTWGARTRYISWSGWTLTNYL